MERKGTRRMDIKGREVAGTEGRRDRNREILIGNKGREVYGKEGQRRRGKE